MAAKKQQSRFTPMEVAQLLGISVKRFHEQIQDGNIPKGRVGEDGRRYYTPKDVEFIQRNWKSKTTAHFMMFTVPLLLVALIFVGVILSTVSDTIHDDASNATPTIPFGYGAPPKLLFEITPEPTITPEATPSIEDVTDNFEQVYDQLGDPDKIPGYGYSKPGRAGS